MGASARGVGRRLSVYHRRVSRWALPLVALALLLATSAQALEAFDGRIQVHGFGEMQLRALNEKFEQQLDLAQWYNILNVELEVDILPDGWGPMDLLSAYVRVEGRYDCVYKRGCGMLRSADSFGDRANAVPERLSDGKLQDYGGVVELQSFTNGKLANPSNRAVPFRGARQTGPGLDQSLVPQRIEGQIVENQGFLVGIKDFYGADYLPNTADDPFNYTMEPFLDFVFLQKNVKNYDGGRVATLGPWLPKNFISAIGGLRNKANPFRGRRTVTPGQGVQGFIRYHNADPDINGQNGIRVGIQYVRRI